MSMNLTSTLIASVFLASFSLSSPVSARLESFTPKQLQEDLKIAKQALEEGHGGIYRYVPKAVVDQHFDNAQRALNNSTDALSFYRILKPAVASIACGHTTALLPRSIKEALNKELLFPMDVKIINGRVFIFRDFTDDGKLAGREILSINGISAQQIVQTMTKAMHGDANIPTMRAIEVGRAFKELLYTIMDMRGQFEVAMRDPKSGRKEQQDIAGQELRSLQQASIRLYPQDQDATGYLSYSFLDNGKIAHLKIDNFNDAEADEDGASMLQTVFEAIREKGSHTLLLDLRNNGGGEDALGKLLFSYLVDKPFSYYDQLTVKTDTYAMNSYAERPIQLKAKWLSPRPDGQFNFLKHPNLGIQQPSLPTFQGRVFILMNGGSFSTTAEFLTQVHTHRRATFIGEESGGGYFGSTSGNNMILSLPNTKVRLVVPLMTYQLSTVRPHPIDRGVMPDYPVQRTISDYLKGRDPEWELALSLARRSNTASLKKLAKKRMPTAPATAQATLMH